MPSPFSETIEKPIILPLFEVEKEVKVPIPTANSFTGDKLGAFAPTTIGILYGKGKSMEIIKQLFDLGILFEYTTDLKEISQSYKKIAEIEASYRNMSLSIDEFLIKDGRLDMDIGKLKQNRGDVEKIKGVLFPWEFDILNKLKAISPESFYLWAIATKVI